MINLKSPRCEEPSCDTICVFGVPAGVPTRCKKHCLPGMVRIGSPQMCIECDSKRAWYGFTLEKPVCCAGCRLDGMVSSHKLCEYCDFTLLNKKYAPYCAQCFCHLNPGDPRAVLHKVRERAFMEPLAKLFKNMVLDRRIQGGTSKRRPDGFIDCVTHGVVVEIDEEQHASYPTAAENRRMVELFEDIACKPLVIVRLNPDKYNENGKEMRSAFKYSHGKREKVEGEFRRRFSRLEKEVAKAIQSVPRVDLTVTYLFFDSMTESFAKSVT